MTTPLTADHALEMARSNNWGHDWKNTRCTSCGGIQYPQTSTRYIGYLCYTKIALANLRSAAAEASDEVCVTCDSRRGCHPFLSRRAFLEEQTRLLTVAMSMYP